MILQRLVELTERLDSNPPIDYASPPTGYRKALVTKAIRLKADGSFRGLIPLSGDGGPKREGIEKLVPRESPQRAYGIVPRLVADNVNYVLGRAREKDNPEDVVRRHQAYRRLLEECAEATGELGMGAILTWVNGGGPESLRNDPAITDDDDFIIEVDGNYPTDDPVVKQFWASRRKDDKQALCLVTGKYGAVVERMPAPIKGVPGGQPTGTALISVNNPAGESYGLSAALNSPIGVYAADRVGTALNYLLASSAHSKRVGKAIYVFWTREPSTFSWDWLDRPEAGQVREHMRSVLTGGAPGDINENDFYMLALSANVSRIVIREYYETTLGAVKQNIAKWFSAISIVAVDGSQVVPFGIYRLATSLYREVDDMPAHVPTALIASAISGKPLPHYLLAVAIKRNAAMQGPFSINNGKRFLSAERVALIKALIPNKENLTLETLTQDHPDAAYHCGRLLAVLERIQRAELGDINATVVDRYYGSACASPGAVLGTLVNKAQSHLSGLRKDKKSYYHELALEEVLTAIGAHFPKTLDLNRQGLFALGFYHQKAHDRAEASNYRAEKAQGESL